MGDAMGRTIGAAAGLGLALLGAWLLYLDYGLSVAFAFFLVAGLLSDIRAAVRDQPRG